MYRDAIGFDFASHWLKNWREIFKSITKRSNRNRIINSYLKTVLWKQYCIEVYLYIYTNEQILTPMNLTPLHHQKKYLDHKNLSLTSKTNICSTSNVYGRVNIYNYDKYSYGNCVHCFIGQFVSLHKYS